MRSIWLIPDRQQTGVVYAIENGKRLLIHELIDVKTLPLELVLGIPEEIFRAKEENYFLFAQFARIEDEKSIFCLSAPAGNDKDGRKVSITNIQILEGNEKPILSPKIPNDCTLLDDIDKKELEKMVSEIDNDTSSNDSIHRMLKAIQSNVRAKSFASEDLIVATNKPDWMPKKKESYFIILKILLVFIILTIIFYSFHYLN